MLAAFDFDNDGALSLDEYFAAVEGEFKVSDKAPPSRAQRRSSDRLNEIRDEALNKMAGGERKEKKKEGRIPNKFRINT